jgi:hypothetical protein
VKRVLASRLIWVALAVAMTVPVIVAATSPLLAWRGPVYIVAGFAGIIGLAALLAQPLLATGKAGRLGPARSRKLHRWLGLGLVGAVVVHVAGLWITSPPDVIDALLFRSPTSFSVWGVLAMWGIFIAALLAAGRRMLPLGPLVWRRVHTAVAVAVVGCSVAHALLIDGTMGTWSKSGLCVLVVIATGVALGNLRLWKR